MNLTAKCSSCGHVKTAALPAGVFRIDACCSQCGHSGIVTLKSFDAAFYKSYTDTWLKVHGSRETKLADDLMPVFKRQAEQVGEALEREYGDRDGEQLAKHSTATAIAKAIFKPGEWVEAIKQAAVTSLGKTMAAGALYELKSFGGAKKTSVAFDFDFGVDLPSGILDGIAAELEATMKEDSWSGIADTQRDDLSSALQGALDDGKDARSIASDVQDVFGGKMGRNRARTIARTESTGAMGAGQQKAREKLHEEGIVTDREWAATFDMLTRHTHLLANGQIRGIREPFMVGGYQAMWPGATNLPACERVNCRCVCLSRTELSKTATEINKGIVACDAHEGCSPWPYAIAS